MHLSPSNISISGPGGEPVLSEAEGSIYRAPCLWGLFEQPANQFSAPARHAAKRRISKKARTGSCWRVGKKSSSQVL